MRKLVVIWIVMICLGTMNLKAQAISVESVREQFFAFDKTKDAALKLYMFLEKADLAKEPVLLAYRGAASAASAGSVNGVRKKLEYFNRGKAELEKAINLKPLDAEIRFLRLATQVNAPGFLGYNGDKKNDKAIILQTMNSVAANHPNAYLYLRICRFMQQHVEMDVKEKNAVNQLVVKFNVKK